MESENSEKDSYEAEQIAVLEGLSAVRVRPAMYIGSTGLKGVHHIVYEVVDNSIDEAMAGFCTKIKVIIHQEGSVSVSDNGRGIPVSIHPKFNIPAVEVVLTKLHAGGKFDNDTYKVSGGLHGVGVSCTNALSEWLVVKVRRDGKIYRQKFQRGNPVTQLEVKGESEDNGTTIRFKPDSEIFTETVFHYDILAKRLRELAFLNSGLEIELVDERDDKNEVFKYDDGLKEFIGFIDKNKNPLHSEVIYFKKVKGKIELEVAMRYNAGYQSNIFSFVNNINTEEGGTHLSGFRTALTRVWNTYTKKINANLTLSGDDVREGLTAVVSVKMPDPQFEGQTKTKLGNSDVMGLVNSLVLEELGNYINENPKIAKSIIQKCIESFKAREAARKARELTRRKNVLEGSNLPGKLSDCSNKDPSKCEIYILEGDSAGGCFSGDTKVALADGRNLSFKELVKEHEEGKKNYSYTLVEKGNVEIELIENPRITKKQTEVVKVILDNDEEIVCTPDHLFMLENQSYKEVGELGEEDLVKGKDSNYKIIKKEVLDKKMDVYDLEVKRTHNFALSSGVFVHNSAKQGRLREFQAILPLRGKVLNVEKARIDKVFQNKEITAIITAIGTGVNDEFDLTKARYHKIIIMCDADTDGAHIMTLLLTFFYRYMKPLVEAGYIYVAMPPLYGVKKGKKIRYAQNDREKEELLKEMGQGATIQRYKGLGEMNPKQLWETTMDPENRLLKQITIEDAVESDRIFTILMGDEVPPRREFIERYAKEVVNLDV